MKINITSLNCKKIGLLCFFKISLHLCCLPFSNAKHLPSFKIGRVVYLLHLLQWLWWHLANMWHQSIIECVTGDEPLLLFANRHDVRLMSLYTHNFKEVVHHLHSAIAVDYDYRGRKIFWSDVGSEKIFRLVRLDQLLFLIKEFGMGLHLTMHWSIWLMDKRTTNPDPHPNPNLSSLARQSAPAYLTDELCRVADVEPRQRLRFQFIFVTDCQPHPTVYRRRPSFSGRRYSHLEQSAWSCHFCTFRSCLLVPAHNSSV